MCLLCVDGKAVEGVSNSASATRVPGKFLDAIHSAYSKIRFFGTRFIHYQLHSP